PPLGRSSKRAMNSPIRFLCFMLAPLERMLILNGAHHKLGILRAYFYRQRRARPPRPACRRGLRHAYSPNPALLQAPPAAPEGVRERRRGGGVERRGRSTCSS